MEISDLLWEAVKHRNIEALKELLEQTNHYSSGSVTDVVNITRQGVSLIHLAVITRDKPVLEILLNSGAELSTCNINDLDRLARCVRPDSVEEGQVSPDDESISEVQDVSVLTLVVSFGILENIQLLLDHEPVCKLDSTGAALQMACFKGNADVVKLLMQRGSEFYNEFFSNQHLVARSPFMCAIEENCVAIIETLLEYGMNPCVTDSQGRTPFHFACFVGNPATVKLLLREMKKRNLSPCLVTASGVSPMHVACRFGNLEVLKLLLNHKCTRRCNLTARKYLLHCASRNQSHDIVRFLLSFGEDPNFGTDKTALLEAVKKDDVEMVQLLLAANADPNIPEPSCTISEYRHGNKENPILYAAEYCSLGVIDALLQGGADVNTTDWIKNSPLTIVAKRGGTDPLLSGDITKLLLKYGANIEHSILLHDFTAFTIAIDSNNVHCAKILLDAGATIDPLPMGSEGFSLLQFARTKECAELLLNYPDQIDINYQNGRGQTALMTACCYNNIDVVHTLINHGADVNLVNDDGGSPLFYAVSSDSPYLVKELIMSGATHNIEEPLLYHFKNILELSLFVGASKSVCDLLHKSGARVTQDITRLPTFKDELNYSHFIQKVPPESWCCKLWIMKNNLYSHYPSESDVIKWESYRGVSTLENICCLVVRRHLKCNRRKIEELMIPQMVKSELLLNSILISAESMKCTETSPITML